MNHASAATSRRTPPPAYHWEQARRSAALHVDALTLIWLPQLITWIQITLGAVAFIPWNHKQ